MIAGLICVFAMSGSVLAEESSSVVIGAFLVGVIATFGGTKLFGKKSATATKE